MFYEFFSQEYCTLQHKHHKEEQYSLLKNFFSTQFDTPDAEARPIQCAHDAQEKQYDNPCIPQEH